MGGVEKMTGGLQRWCAWAPLLHFFEFYCSVSFSGDRMLATSALGLHW